MHPLDQILQSWRQEAARASFSRSRDMGTTFEKLCIAFFTHDPVQAAQFSTVQPYGEWARQRDLPSHDTGIDLVAALRDEPGAYAAIQCKFRDTQGSIAKGEIDSFLAASGRPEFRASHLDGHHGAGLVRQGGRDLAAAGEAGAAHGSARLEGQPHPLGRVCPIRCHQRAGTGQNAPAPSAGGHQQRPEPSQGARHPGQTADGLRHRQNPGGLEGCRGPCRRRGAGAGVGAQPGAALPDPAGLAGGCLPADPRLCGVLRPSDGPAPAATTPTRPIWTCWIWPGPPPPMPLPWPARPPRRPPTL